MKFLRTYWKQLAFTAAALAAVLFALARPVPDPVPASEHFTLDSFLVTMPQFRSRVDNLTRFDSTAKLEVAKLTAVAARERAAAKSARHAADSIADVADSLAVLTAGDTTSLWHMVAVDRALAIDSLRASNDSLRAAGDSLARAVATATARADSANAKATLALARTQALEEFNGRLVHDLKVQGQCHILPFIPCPSRVQAAGLGALAGGLAHAAVTR